MDIFVSESSKHNRSPRVVLKRQRGWGNSPISDTGVKFGSSDLSAVKNLIHNTIDVCYSATYPKEAIKFFKGYHCEESILKGAKEGHTIVLEQSDRIVGTGTMVDDHIVRVFVAPAFQKNGFGKLIMWNLEAKASSQELLRNEVSSIDKFIEKIESEAVLLSNETGRIAEQLQTKRDMSKHVKDDLETEEGAISVPVFEGM